MLFARPVRNLTRWRDVQAILLRYGFDFLIEKEEVRGLRDFLSKRFKLPTSETLDRSLAERVCKMTQELGPTFIKLGQILSSRSDILPEEWTREFSKLQDEVASFPFEYVKKTIEEDFGKPIQELFFDFDPVPIAAASIGQVHRARLLNMNEVVVKVRRPGIVPQVQSDLEITRELGRLIESRTNWGKRYGIVSIMDEFARTLTLEMDYRNEAANAIRLRRNMASIPDVHVPYVYWDLTSERVLTLEYIEGIKVNNLQRLDELQVDRKKLADVFIHSIFRQLMIDGFYHADPHPGNLFVDIQNHSLVYLDLGMMGSLLADQRQILGDIVRSMLRRDSADVTRLVLTIGTPYQKVDEGKLCRAIDHIINRYLELSLEDISFASLIAEILSIIFKYGIRLPSEYSLALKTIVQGEEVARQLDNQIVIIDIARAVSQQIVVDMLTPANLVDQLNDSLREFLRLRKEIPRALESIIKQVESGSLTVAVDVPDFDHIINSIIIIANRLTAGLIIVGMLIGSALAMGITPEKGMRFIPILGIIGFIAAMLFGGILVWSVVRDIIATNRRKKRFK